MGVEIEVSAVEISERACSRLKMVGQRISVWRLAVFIVGTVQFVRTVFAVPEQRAADGCHVRANLVGASGEQLAFNQR